MAFKGFKDNKDLYMGMTEDGKKKALFNLLSNITIKDRRIVSLQWNPPYGVIAKPPKKDGFVIMRAW